MKIRFALLFFALLGLMTTHAASVAIGLGIRETGSTEPIGGNGGTGGSLEWIDRGVNVVTTDGLWQTLSYNLSNASVRGFTGDGALGSANGFGVLEHLVFDQVGSSTGPFSVYLDNLTYTPLSDPAVVIASWEGLADGSEVVFQEPGFSGSTSGRLADSGSSGTVSGGAGNNSDGAYKVDFEWAADDSSNWLRLTTFNTGDTPNPTVGLDGTISIDVRVIPEPHTSFLLFLAAAFAIRRRQR